jgi:hypothetical protein
MAATRSAILTALVTIAVSIPSVCAASLPVLPLEAASAPWAAAGSAACRGGFCGDIRARLSVAPGDIVAGVATAQIFWRRRDPFPANKAVIVTDAAGAAVAVLNSSVVESTCGVISFSATAGGTFFAYYLPFQQGNGGAWTTFSWTGCNDTAYDESNECVLGRRRLSASAASSCLAATPAALLAVALENRDDFNKFTEMEMMASPAELAAATQALAQRPGGAPWVGTFPEDRARAVRVFDGGIPARWLPGGGGADPYSGAPAFFGAAAPGEYFTFQVGLWAFAAGASGVSACITDLAGPGGAHGAACGSGSTGAAIGASLVNFINIDGVDIGGIPFTNKNFSVAAGAVASLWVGVAVPADAAAGNYSGTLFVSTFGRAPPLAVDVTLGVSGAPVADGGAADVTGLSRLSWLYSTRGHEDSVPAPFTPVKAEGGGGSGLPLVVGVPLKRIAVGADGMLAQVDVSMPRRVAGACEPGGVLPGRFGAPMPGYLATGGDVVAPAANLTLADAQALCAKTRGCAGITFEASAPSPAGLIARVYLKDDFAFTAAAGWWSFAFCSARAGTAANALLAAPVRFELFDVGAAAALPAELESFAGVTALSNSSVTWQARSRVAVPSSGAGASLLVATTGSVDFTSYANFAVTITNDGAAPVALGDVRVTLPVSPQMGAYVVGMDNGGANAAPYADRLWRWTNSTGANKIWLGRAEGGVLLNLKGPEIKWDSPMFGEDYPVIPYVPTTWGGADAQPVSNIYGVNVTNCTAVAFSGPRVLAAGESVTFLFDLALTPSKLANYTRHFATRAFQVGYGTDYYSPQQMDDMGVKVVTLHQGTPGIVNGSMINPWIK